MFLSFRSYDKIGNEKLPNRTVSKKGEELIMCKTNEVIDEITTRLKSGKIRTIEINKSEKEHIYIYNSVLRILLSYPNFTIMIKALQIIIIVILGV